MTDSVDRAADIAVAADPRAGKVRAVFAGLLGVLAVCALVASVVVVWARNTVFDSAKVAHAVDNALQNSAVTDAAGVYLTDQVFQAVDVNGYVVGVLPAPLQRLAPAIVAGIETRVEKAMGALLSQDKVRHLVVGIVERAHQSLMRVLKGDGLLHGVTVKNGAVTVNLLPLIGLGLDQIHNLGLLQNVTLPAFTVDGDPATQIAALSKVLHRDLPADFGQLVVYRSDAVDNAAKTLSTAQKALIIAKRAMYLILLLTVALFAAAVVVANRRRRAVAVLAVSSGVVMLVTHAALRRAVAQVPALLVRPGAKAAAIDTIDSLASGLFTMVSVIAIAGLVVAIGLWITGPSARAAALRAGAGSASSSAGGIVAQHADLVAFALAILAVVVIVVTGFGLWQLIVAGALAAVAGWVYWGRSEATAPPAA
ncbi:MAG: hypothetical protein WCI22_13705 [Actinomycetota bacterium]